MHGPNNDLTLVIRRDELLSLWSCDSTLRTILFLRSLENKESQKNKFRSPYLICLQNLPSIGFGSHQRYTYSTLTIMPKTFPKIVRDSPSKWLLARSAVPKGKRPPVFLFNSWMAMASYELLVVYRLFKWEFGFSTVTFLCYFCWPVNKT